VELNEESLEELARILLSCQELRGEFANLVNTLTSQAKSNLDADSNLGGSAYRM